MDYINTGYDSEYSAEEEYNRVVRDNDNFKFDDNFEKETFRIYELLTFMHSNNRDVRSFMFIYKFNKFDEIARMFNDSVVNEK